MTPQEREALKLARRAINNLIAPSNLKDPQPWRDARQDSVDALTAIEEALAQQNPQGVSNGHIDEAAPVAKNEGGRITWLIEDWPQNCLLYTHPPVPYVTPSRTAQPKEPEQEPVAAAIWDEGYQQGIQDERMREAYIEVAGFEPARQNPYGATPPQPKEPEQEPVGMYRNKCADGSRCLHGCHTNEPCYSASLPKTLMEELEAAWQHGFTTGNKWR